MTRIHRDDHESPSRLSQRRAPPNHRSRGMQLQLFALVAALMTVLIAMNEARKPQTWAWLWGRGQQQAEAPIDSRLPLDLPVEDSPEAKTPQSEPVSDESILKTVAGDRGKEQYGAAAWQRIYTALDREQKQRLTAMLRAQRLNTNPPPDERARWHALLSTLDSRWSQFIQEQQQALEEPDAALPPDQKKSATAVLKDLEQRWAERDRPALAAAAGSDSVSDEQRQVLADLQSVFDHIDLAAVRDDTVWRPDDREAWFRLLEQLQNTDERSLSEQSLGEVTFIQIFRQSKEYRGKLVTVRGTARLGYRVVAPRNDLGITGYYLLWLRPADGTNIPIVVYCLELPSNFPPLSQEEQTELRHEVAITGYFFKRWVYRAQDGLNSVPLMVAKMPIVIPQPKAPESQLHALARILGGRWWLAVLLLSVPLAVLAAVLVWLIARSSRSRVATAIRPDEDSVPWDKLPPTTSVEESLRRMEQQDRQHR